MSGAWLLVPVLLPAAGGLALFRIHGARLRRLVTLGVLAAETVLSPF